MKPISNKIQLCVTLIVTLGAIAIPSGCKSTTFQHEFADGTKIKVTDRRAFIRTEIEFSGSISTNGAKIVTLKAKSDANAEALKSVAEGAAQGVVKGFGKSITP